MGVGETRTSAGGSRRSLVCFLALLAACLLLVAGSPAGAATFVQQWGGLGTGPGQFDNPLAIAVDSAGNVYVADSFNDRVQKFTEGGAYVTEWSGSGLVGGTFFDPSGVAVDAAGYVYVADSNNDRVQKFTNGGAFVHEWGRGEQSEPALSFPQGIAADGAGSVYVADTGNNRIVKYTDTGAFVTNWGVLGSGPGQFSNVKGVAADGAGNVYVADTGNSRVQKFNSAGVPLGAWGIGGTDVGQLTSPFGVAVDNAGVVYVADIGTNRVQTFDGSGTLLSHFGSEGSGPGQFFIPTGVAPGAAGRIFVVDNGNNRVQVFGPDPVVLPPPPAGLSAPVFGKTVNLSLIGGIVKVKLPGSKKFVLLTADMQVPVGTVIDATKGKVKLTSAKGPGGGTQSADFYSGIFKVLQPKKGKPLTVLKLQDPPVCGKTNHLSALASRKRGNGLWGSGKGSFRSEGRHGSATVRGTIWWAQDTCRGTLFKVKKGVVLIEDFGSDETLKLRAGQKYLAPAD